MERSDAGKNETTEESKQQDDEGRQDGIFDTEEILIEEMAIDGICGVY